MKGYALRDPRKNFENYIWSLLDNGVIEQSLTDELHELRRYRNTIHLNPDKTPEIEGNGLPEDWNRAVKALRALEVCLMANA